MPGQPIQPSTRGRAALFANWRSTRVVLPFALLYAALFSAYGTESPFFPSFMRSRGVGAEQIGFVFAAGTLVRVVVGPLFGRLADALQATRAVLGVGAAAAAGIALFYIPATGFPAFLLISMAHSAAEAPLAPLADTAALAAMRGRRRFSYGTMRGIGSAAFIAGTLASGVFVGAFGLQAIVGSSATLLAATAVAAALLPREQAPTAAGVAGTLPQASAAALLRNAAYLRTMAVVTLVIGSHAMNDAFSVIRWQAAGLSPGTIGVLWSESVVSEVFVFALAGAPIIARLGIGGAAAVAAAAGIVRWSVLSLTSALPVLAGVQLLHGLTFALMHLVAMTAIAETVPPALSATAQTVYSNICLGIASAVLASCSGILYAHQGPQAFLTMAALCAGAIPLALTLPALGRRTAA